MANLALWHEVRDGNLHTVGHDIEDFIEVVARQAVAVAALQPLAEMAGNGSI